MKYERIIKIILAVLLLLCLLKWPYGFYQFVRLASVAGFGFLAYKSYVKERKVEVIIYIALIILFQPVYKIALGRELWNIVDVIIGVGLLVSIYLNDSRKDN